MRGGRRRLPVLGEVAGPAAGPDRPWSLSSSDLEALKAAHERLGDSGVVLVSGEHVAAIQTLAVGLAAVAAAAGRRTVLVDAELEGASLAAAVGLASMPGMHEYLRWEATPQQVVQPLALAGPAAAPGAEPLAFVAAGRAAADPATLLGLQSFRHMSAKLRSAYELVVIAAPPLGAPAALAALAVEADAALLALGTEQAGAGERRALAKELRRLGAEPRGAVVVQRS